MSTLILGHSFQNAPSKHCIHLETLQHPQDKRFRKNIYKRIPGKLRYCLFTRIPLELSKLAGNAPMNVIQKLVSLSRSHSKNLLTQNNNTLKEVEEEEGEGEDNNNTPKQRERERERYRGRWDFDVSTITCPSQPLHVLLNHPSFFTSAHLSTLLLP